MRDDASKLPEPLAAEVLQSLVDTPLFYPCCGPDLILPIQLFGSVVSDFYFVDIRRQRRPKLHGLARRKMTARAHGDADVFVHLASQHEFRVHLQQHRAEMFLDELPKLGVFFFRGDNPVDGEGSSGVRWLGGELFTRVLTRLIPGGLVVTDGSNPGPNGPRQLSDFYHDPDVGSAAASAAVPFQYGGRSFRCIGYAGDKYGPTLIWRVS